MKGWRRRSEQRGMGTPRALAPANRASVNHPGCSPQLSSPHPKPAGCKETSCSLTFLPGQTAGSLCGTRVPSAHPPGLGVSRTQPATYYEAAPTSPEFSPGYGLLLQKTFKQTGLSPAPTPLRPKAGDCQPKRISQWTFSCSRWLWVSPGETFLSLH